MQETPIPSTRLVSGGTAGDAIAASGYADGNVNEMKLSTKDQNNDNWTSSNCAV